MVTTNRRASYDAGILRQDYEVIRGLPMNHTRFADCDTILVVHLPERTEMGGPYHVPDQTMRAVHSCNSFLKSQAADP